MDIKTTSPSIDADQPLYVIFLSDHVPVPFFDPDVPDALEFVTLCSVFPQHLDLRPWVCGARSAATLPRAKTLKNPTIVGHDERIVRIRWMDGTAPMGKSTSSRP